MTPHLSRRTLLAGTAAALALPPRRASAQAGRFAASADRARGLDQLHALVVSVNGETVLAEAFRGPALGRAVNVKSVSKTIVAALTGAAIDRGVVPGVDATLGQVAPQLIPAGADPAVAGLTLEDLMTLQAGLERTSGGEYGAWVASPNWVADALGRPMIAAPGQRMLYSTGTTHVLGAVLAEASGESLLALARGWLGAPLGIEIPAWTRDPQGYYLGGNEMALSPLAMLAFGEMVRQGGIGPDGGRVLGADFVAASMEAHTRSPFSGLDYGYGWFLGRRAGQTLALARGYGGQVIALVPGLGMSIVITSDTTRPARSEGHFGDLMALIGEAVIPDAARV